MLTSRQTSYFQVRWLKEKKKKGKIKIGVKEKEKLPKLLVLLKSLFYRVLLTMEIIFFFSFLYYTSDRSMYKRNRSKGIINKIESKNEEKTIKEENFFFFFLSKENLDSVEVILGFDNPANRLEAVNFLEYKIPGAD